MQGLTIEQVKLTPEAASHIFQTAIDAGHTYGFGYWAELKDMTNKGDLITSITLQELEGRIKQRRHLDVTDLERGIAKSLSEPDGIKLSGLSEEYPDGPTSEAILQYAMFGKQIYG